MNRDGTRIHHLGEAPDSDEGTAIFDTDIATHGFVMNASRLWAHQPSLYDDLFRVVAASVEAAGLTVRQRSVLVSATASAMGDSYCSLAWGTRLANAAGACVARAVLAGSDDGLPDDERALAEWARSAVRDPNGTSSADLDSLRGAGFDDGQILALTLFVALRLAFSTVNDALGARPDRLLVDRAPIEVIDAVRYGRRPLG